MLPSNSRPTPSDTAKEPDKPFAVSPPALNLPKGGGAIRGIGEKFAANPVTGTGSMTVPIATSPGRSGFGPQLSLSYDSGSGNGPFGFGWSLSLPSITRKTDKGLPQYRDAEESDVFILSGAEDLVPVLNDDGTRFKDDMTVPGYTIHRYRPRIEGLFARIERWTDQATGETHWRSITRDNITTLYGKDNNSRIFDPADPNPNHPTRIFSWLICASYDDKGSAIVYEYKTEDSQRILEDDKGQSIATVYERNRTDATRSANRYLKRIKYGNRIPNRDANWQATEPSQLTDWMFEVVFDYGEGHYSEDAPDTEGRVFVRAQIDLPPRSHWPVRDDTFSRYRAGFEVRTYRLCHRVLMFHHFPQELKFPNELKFDDCLVRSTEFRYSESPVASFITSVSQSGYVRQPDRTQANLYLKKSLPPLEFAYSQVPSPEALAQQPVLDVDPESSENLPIGLDGGSYQWIDLDGEGTSGILTEQADGWYYKRNLSPNQQAAKLGPIELVNRKPVGGFSGGAQLLDLAGDGQVDLVQMDGPVRGFHERTPEGDWTPFQPFVSWPELDTRDPDLRFVDLTGDGHADILITESEAMTWHPSLAEEGFGPAIRLSLPMDEEMGPRLIFADGTQSIYLADLSGDGLSDLARIRNGEVCYWPNLGYGRFGTKVTMDSSPWFDSLDQFDQRRIRLVDTDGSGTTDMLYLHGEGVRIYLNQSGNRWSDPIMLPQFPPIDNISAVQTVDLLGNGTACLVWSSSLPGDARRPMRYIALMKEKPHLLIRVSNNLGAETRVHYAPSTKFYLDDKHGGKPWITRLPFPVHVVERVETCDHISRNRFVSRYFYHHGYFDGEEREFRGFGMVEQWDTEEIGTIAQGAIAAPETNWDAASFVPPVVTRTWFHTGAYIRGGHISTQFEHEYYREGDASRGEAGLTDEQLETISLADTVLPGGLSPEEIREACRSLKGSILRQEVYGQDSTEKADRPYTVSERNYTIQVLQLRGENRHAVFFTHARETVDFHYERQLIDMGGKLRADPRITHTLTLKVDEYGNVERSVSIGYRRRDVPGIHDPEQKDTHFTLTVSSYANEPDENDWYRIGLPVETRTFELVKPPEPNVSGGLIALFAFSDAAKDTENLFPLNQPASEDPNTWPYENWDWRRNPAHALRESKLRLIEHVRTYYRPDDMGKSQNNDPMALLPLGDVESLALPGETYRLAFTQNLVKNVFVDSGKIPVGDVDQVFGTHGGYVHTEGDGDWWVPSGRIFHSPKTNDPPAMELTYARSHFFLPHRFRDPFDNETILTYDSDPADPARNHNLLLVETRDAVGNVVTANTQDDQGNAANRNDYRVLQPYWVTDPNRNRTRVVFDAVGLVVATAVMGKPGEKEGDLIGDTFEPDLSAAKIQDIVKDPRGNAFGLLTSATTCIIYDLHRFMRCGQPPFAATLAREIHFNDSGGGASPVQLSLLYSDGFGREIQTKVQAEAGIAPQRAANVLLASGDIKPGDLVRDATGKITQANTAERWVGTGRTVYNNKGKPIKKYEPFFSPTHLYESEPDMTDTGVTLVLFYDPAERDIATLHPNHTYEKVVFDPWQQTNYDVNDTVMFDPRDDEDVRGYVSEYFKQIAPRRSDWETWLQQRDVDPLAPLRDTPGLEPEKKAALRTLLHADTPTIAHFDSLARTFLMVTNNGKDANGNDVFYETRVVFDIEGNQREVIDARARVVLRYDYDMLGNRIHQASVDAGERWMLNDVLGKPIRAWDSRGFMRQITYDALRRPTELRVRLGQGDELRAQYTVYGEAQGDAENHRGRVYRIFDGAGIATNEEYDFKGNLLRSNRQLVADYKNQPDWSANPGLEPESFISSILYDALNRPIQIISPHSDRSGSTIPTTLNVIQSSYNEANLLERLDVWLELRGLPDGLLDPAMTASSGHGVRNINYNAKGQRELIQYGNGVITSFAYDPATFRLTHLETTRPNHPEQNRRRLQDLTYTYDPVGNIVYIQDRAQPRVYFDNDCIDASNDYEYDAIYRLIAAQGREHRGRDFQPDWDETSRMGNPIPYNCQEMRHYVETFRYDEVGNILQMIHHDGSNLVQPGRAIWNRHYQYEPDNNRLRCTSSPGDAPLPEYSTASRQYGHRYTYDDHGNMISMPHLSTMAWDFEDQLQMTDLGGGGKAYYLYDASGQRMRKVLDRQDGTRQEERIYLAGFENYREYSRATGAVDFERETLQMIDNKQRVALVETRTLDTAGTDRAPRQIVRYQHDNHLGSAVLELDSQAEVITYEEYYPYGNTSYQAGSNQIETPKRYRYTGKERDDESGLYYHNARYYAPWLGVWISTDPAKYAGHLSPYSYSQNNPIIRVDHSGLADVPADALKKAQDLLSGASNRLLHGLDEFTRESVEFEAQGGRFIRESDATIVKGHAKNLEQHLRLGRNDIRNIDRLLKENKNLPSGLRGQLEQMQETLKKHVQLGEVSQQRAAAYQNDPQLSKRFAGSEFIFPTRPRESGKGSLISERLRGRVTRLGLGSELGELIPKETLRKFQGAPNLKSTSTTKGFISSDLFLRPIRAAGATAAQTFKALIPGSEFYDYTKLVGGGSILAGARVISQWAVAQGTQLAQFGSQAFAAIKSSALAAGGGAGVGLALSMLSLAAMPVLGAWAISEGTLNLPETQEALVELSRGPKW